MSSSEAARVEDQRRLGPAPIDARGGPLDRIEVRLVKAGIEQIGSGAFETIDGTAVDAIAVGHYLGLKPRGAELALDKAISSELPGKVAPSTDGATQEPDRLLTQFSERGIIRGELGQPFFVTDPRTEQNLRSGTRVIAIAGMGEPGRFGVPELTVLARELCWSLGRLDKRHLATVLIGAGRGNLAIRDAVGGWMRGLVHAASGSLEDRCRRLRRVTFVEHDPRKIDEIQDAILDAMVVEQQRLKRLQINDLKIDYVQISEDQLNAYLEAGLELERQKWERERGRRRGKAESTNGSPTRITFVREGESYRFGAITEDASIPEREIPLDPLLVDRANAELAAETGSAMQLERGRFMERLLVPNDLRPHLSSRAPLVLWLDATTARIHWEMVAQSDLNPFPRDTREPTEAEDQDSEVSQQIDFEASFLGTSRGLTRQLRTTFSPPPDPPPPPRRLLRVLIVVDPASDAPLKGAQEEGRAVEELFNRFNTVYARLPNRIQVVRLSGPGIATRTNVLRHLMLHGYDVLHFAGHCIYDRKYPASSGWIFTGGERITANELQRVDRVPKFIFSNACESGQTPDRSGECSAELAPSFAETFFARGVSNFVCTAWSVEDLAALRFARRLYAGLLGLTEGREGGNADGSAPPEAMHEAMRAARLAVATEFNGGGSWGAYQHYGNPYFRLFDAPTLGQSQAASDPTAGGPAGTVPLRRRPRASDPGAA